MKRVSLGRMIGAVLMTSAMAGAVSAADLPGSGYGPGPGASQNFFGAPAQPGLITNPFKGQFFVEPGRFDAYGDPVYGPVINGAPNSLYMSSGCRQLLQPTYDVAGNLMGYAPIPGCR